MSERTRVTLTVEDSLADWNDDTFTLEVADGEATCERSSADSDAEIDVGALSQLVVGYRSAGDLERAGRLTVAEGEVTETLTRLFPETQVYLRDFF